MKAEEQILNIIAQIGKTIGETGALYGNCMKEGKPLEHYQDIVDNLRVVGVKCIECAFTLSNIGRIDEQTRKELERVAGFTKDKTS